MSHRTVSRSTIAFAVLSLLSVAAQAAVGPGLFRSYVSSTGNDANTCTLPAPCRLLPAALAAVADGGEIWMLDSANYNTGPVDIAKSVTILAIPGALGSVVAAGGNAINITATSLVVTLRNLNIIPFPGAGGLRGIEMNVASDLTIEQCHVSNLPQEGIFVNAAGARVGISDSTVINSGSHGIFILNGAQAVVTRATVRRSNGAGILAQGAIASTLTKVEVGDSTIDWSGTGIVAYSTDPASGASVSVRDSRISQNIVGLNVQSDAAGPASISASNNMISNNTSVGFRVFSSGAKAWASGNTINGNSLGFFNSGGLFETAGNNAVRNNSFPTSGIISPVVPTI